MIILEGALYYKENPKSKYENIGVGGGGGGKGDSLYQRIILTSTGPEMLVVYNILCTF